VLQILLAAFALVLLFSMLRMRRWAWIALMLWSIGGMLVNLILYFYGHPNYLNMCLMVVIVFSLAQGEVLAALGIRRRINESVH
jgi:ABC-type thiamin/hydroxymethylpyrimidine transport system permease subunit